jgi:hypothetical protein
MLSGVTPGYLITYLLHEGMESQKSDYSRISIEGPTDAIALRQDGNFLRSRLKFSLTSSSLTMSVSISESRSPARLKRSPARYEVGIENGAATGRGERARLKPSIESRVFSGVKK